MYFEADVIPKSEGGTWSWLYSRMFIHPNSNLSEGELLPGKMQRCKLTLTPGAKRSFSWDKNITFLNWSFLYYCLQKTPKPKT